MASKVNVKFVAILSVSLVVFAAIVGAAGFMLVFKSGAEHARIGDKLAEQGQWDQARRSFAKAVNKEPTTPEYLTKWADAIRHVNPTSETEYRDLLLNDLFSSYSQLSAVQPTDVAAQRQLLDFTLSQFQISLPTPERAMGLVDRATTAIERFETAPPADDAWKTLYRYRGIPLASAMNAGNKVEEPLRTQARADLELALQGDPGDEKAAIALAWWHAADAGELEASGQVDAALTALGLSVGTLDGFLAEHPSSPAAMLERVIRSNQADIMAATRGMLGDDAMRLRQERQRDMALGLPDVAEAMLAADPKDVSPNILLMLSRVEQLADPQSELARSSDVAEHLCDTTPVDAQMLVTAANIQERRGQLVAALVRYDELAELESLPISVDGLIQLNLRRDAMYHRSRLRLESLLGEPDAADHEARLTEARSNRQEFAQQVSDEEPRLRMLDGLIAQASNELTTAREAYRRYNEQTLLNDPVGLWRQTQTALQLDFETEAETLLMRMLELQPGNRTATLALAEVYYQQEREALSLRLFEAVGAAEPENEGIQTRIRQLRASINPEGEGNDPVLSARARALALRNGTSEEPGDLEASVEYLRGKVVELEYAEPVAIDLIQNYLDLARVEDARGVAQAAVLANPDSERLKRFLTALNAESVTETLIALINQSDRSDIEMAITKYRVYLSQNDVEAALEQIDTAITIDPEYPLLVEIRFDNAVGMNDLAVADEMAGVAGRLNLDKADGSLYRARVLSVRGEHDQAISMLERVIAEGKTFPMAFRLLAGEQAEQGRFEEAIQTLERALALNENDPPTQLQYIRLLAVAGRAGDALTAARKGQFAGQPPKYITDAWLELEALSGDEAGRNAAIVRRETIRSLKPDDTRNNAALAELYILTRQFTEAKPLIDLLHGSELGLGVVLLDMRWHADQGRLLVDGEPVNGLAAAQRLFQDYLLEQDEESLASEAFLLYARFMISRNQMDLALPAIERARELQEPGSLDADRLLGDLYYNRGRFAEAAEVFGRLVGAGADTEDQAYRKRLVESLIRVNRYADAMGELDKVQTADLTTMLQRAEILFGLERAGEARQILDQAVQRYPNNPLVYVRRAEVNVGDDALAGDVMADLQQALRIDPKNWRALRLRGVLQWEQGRRVQAIADIRAAVAANTQLERLLFGLMNELIVAGQDGQAADIADETIEARPNDAQLMLNCARVFANHDLWDRATGYTRQAWLQSKDQGVGVLLVDSLVRLVPSKVDEAEAVYNQLVRLVPDEAEGMLMLATLATVRHAQGRENSTARALTQALSQIEENPGDVLGWAQHVRRVYRDEPDQASAMMKRIGADPDLQVSDLIGGWLEFVTAQQLVGEPTTADEGITLLRELRNRSDTDPLSQLAYRVEGTTLYARDDYEGARTVWAEGLARFPEDWEMLNNQAYLLGRELGQAAEALPLAERAMRLANTELSSYDTLAMVYTKLERYDEAATTLQSATGLAVTPAEKVTVMLAKVRLHLAKHELEHARKVSTEARAMVFGSVGLAEMAAALDELDIQIDSASP